jgi:hypothetical protein
VFDSFSDRMPKVVVLVLALAASAAWILLWILLTYWRRRHRHDRALRELTRAITQRFRLNVLGAASRSSAADEMVVLDGRLDGRRLHVIAHRRYAESLDAPFLTLKLQCRSMLDRNVCIASCPQHPVARFEAFEQGAHCPNDPAFSAKLVVFGSQALADTIPAELRALLVERYIDGMSLTAEELVCPLPYGAAISAIEDALALCTRIEALSAT